jgi:hypothetical protein
MPRLLQELQAAVRLHVQGALQINDLREIGVSLVGAWWALGVSFGCASFGCASFGRVSFGRVSFGRVSFGRVSFGRVRSADRTHGVVPALVVAVAVWDQVFAKA